MNGRKVAVIGQGYVGLPLAVRASQVGYSVIGFDLSRQRVDALNAGVSYVADVSDAELAAALRRGYRATPDSADLAGFDIAVVSVPTPLTDGAPDLSFIEAAAKDLAPHIRAGCTVILESTTYPGTTTELFAPILEAGSGLRAGPDFHLGYSPERIDPGNQQFTLVTTPKVVSGVDEASLAKVDEFFSSIVDRTVPVQSTAQAELVKLLENTFRHVNIALVNELAIFAHQLGVDIWQTIDAATTKPFGYMRFTPGPGVGGHCLPVDPSYLAWEVKRRTGQTFRFIELANDVNSAMPRYVVERAQALLQRHGIAIDGANVLLLGLAYKKATSDWRESPSIDVAEQLTQRGARVTFCDPYVPEVNTGALTYPMVTYSPKVMADADLVILLVDHPEFEPGQVATAASLVLDTKGALRHERIIGEIL